MEDSIFANEQTEAPKAPKVEVKKEEAPVEEKKEAPKPKAKAKAKAAPAKKAPGMYFEGKLIEKVPARLGRKWTVVIDGQRHKVLKSDIEIVE